MKTLVRSTLAVFAVLTVVTGLLYPLAVTLISQLVFPSKANGSIATVDGKPVGSSLIGQPFDDPRYLWSRPSATSPVPYNGASSSGSNQGPLNPALAQAVTDRVAALRASDPGNTAPVPIDLVTASASGLDPHISPEAAEYQIPRVARARGVSEDAVLQAVKGCAHGPTLGFLGDARVNVWCVNLKLDGGEISD
jgi:K+-transporting ATPase ATPase C chain